MKHDNNFDLLRLLAALSVAGYHMGELTQRPEFHLLVLMGARIAIEVFFVISGFLIFQSYENSKNLRHYFGNRVRRIVPGYVFVILLMAVAGAALSTLPPAAYFGLPIIKYIVSNLLLLNFIEATLPGVFVDNRWPIVNGSLWTIKVEVAFYIFVPVFVWLFRRFGRKYMLVIGYILSACWWGGFTALAEHTGRDAYFELGKQLPGQLMYFFSGAVLFYYHDVFLRHAGQFALFGVVGITVATVWSLDYVYPLALAILTIYIALIIPRLVNATRFGDMSYGIYILHFPLLQAMVSQGLFKQYPWAGAVLFLILLLVGAQISWHFVERPFIRRRSRPPEGRALVPE